MTRTVVRPLHSHAALKAMFDPQSIAIVGISSRPNSFGGRTWDNMSRFKGRLYAVNPKYQSFAGQACYPDVAALPEVPDCVALSTSRELTLPVLKQCVQLGVKSAVVFASGYAETGKPELREQQERLGELARSSGLRILGPNSMGFVNNASGIGLTFVTDIPFTPPSDYAVGLVTQSGATGTALLQGSARGKAFSHLLMAGNSEDVDVADQIAYLVGEEHCKAIACVFEGIADPARLIEAGLIARRAGKPVVIFKVGRSTEGAAAATSHTGAVAGSDAAYSAAFERGCMVVVEEFEHLLDTASFLAKASRLGPAAPGVAVLSISGGLGIMAADKASAYGVPLPQPPEAVRDLLKAHLPEFGSPRNPLDLTAQLVAVPQSLHACTSAILAVPDYGAIVFPHPLAQETSTQRLRVVNDLARQSGKIACIPWVTEWLEGPGASEAEQMTHAAVFRSTAACFAALRARTWWHMQRALPIEKAHPSSAHRVARARALLGAACGPTLTEGEGMRLLSAYDIPVVEDQLTGSGEEAVAAAESMGFPVAMKIVSRDVPHKTESGGVRLGLCSAEAVREAHAAILQNVKAAVPYAQIDGVVVQPMAGAGVELIVGSKLDPVFGPLIVVGLGGIFVELMKDVCVRIAPVSIEEATGMLRSLRGAKVFEGFRGMEAVDLSSVAGVVARVSELAAELANEIEEIDVNPLICTGKRVIAVDALVTCRRA